MSVTPDEWARTLSHEPVLDRTVSGLVPATVRRWRGIDPDIEQSALDRHFISIHLGGAKRLHRRGEGGFASSEVVSGAYSVVPAGAAFRWETEGPIDFMHVYFDPRVVEGMIERGFDRNPANVAIEDVLGGDDPLVRALADNLLAEFDQFDRQQAYLDDLLRLLLCRTLRLHSDVRRTAACGRYALAPYRLRRALDFIEANLASPIGVADIADASGISRYHFSRAFQRAIGKAPYAYLLDRRISAAKTLLLHSDLSLSEIGRRCGFANPSQFSRMFKGEARITPSAFRDAQ